jgi:hypothetical protein
MVKTLPPFEMIERAPGCYSVLGEVDVATSPHLRQLAGRWLSEHRLGRGQDRR